MQFRARYPSGIEQILDVEGVTPGTYQQRSFDGTVPFYIGVASANLTDADSTISVSDGNQFVLPPATLSTNRTKTLGTSGSPATTEAITIVRRDVTANTLAVVNGGGGGGTLYTFPVSVKRQATFAFDGTNWYLASTVALS
jgi:hypothetical protein